jgi:hypothetical protein
MHRTLIYADTTKAGLEKMEIELLEGLNDSNPELNIEWISWQLDSDMVSPEDKWKIMYFLINDSKITLTAVKKSTIVTSNERKKVAELKENYYEEFYSIVQDLGLNEDELSQSGCEYIITELKSTYREIWKEL